MKWADKIDIMEAGRASDEAVAHLVSPWATSNLQLRADRDFINETARKSAEARKANALTRDGFLALADKFADQQRQTVAQAEAAAWR